MSTALQRVARMRTSQPRGATGIDWRNPLARDLMVVLLPAGAIEAVSGAPLRHNGAAGSAGGIVAGPGRHGTASTSGQNGGSFAVASRPAYRGGSYTTFVLVDYDANTLSNYVYLCGANGPGDDGYGIGQHHPATGLQWFAYATSSGMPISGALMSSGEPLPLGLHLLVHTFDGATHRLYRNGVLKASAAGTAGSRCDANFVHSNVQESLAGNGLASSSPIYLSGRYARALSDAEVASLADNPWQLFEPEYDFIPYTADLALPERSASSSITLDSVTQASTAGVLLAAGGSAALGSVTQVATAAAAVAAGASQALGPVTQASSASSTLLAGGSAALGPVGQVSTAKTDLAAAAAAVLGSVSQASSASLAVLAQASTALGPVTQTSAAALAVLAQSSTSLASVQSVSTAKLFARLEPMRIRPIKGRGRITVFGDPTPLPPPRVALLKIPREDRLMVQPREDRLIIVPMS